MLRNNLDEENRYLVADGTSGVLPKSEKGIAMVVSTYRSDPSQWHTLLV